MLDWGILRRAWCIAWPLIVAEAVDSVLSVTDMFFVSKLGDEATAAIGLAGYASWLFFVSVQLFYMGVLVLAAQAYGAERPGEASRILGESLPSAFLTTLPIAAAGYFYSFEFLGLLGGWDPATVPLASDYFRVRVLVLPLVAVTMTISAAFRAVGMTKPVMVATVSGALVNIVLDPLLIFGLGPFPRLGIVGAAVASAAAFVVDFALHVAFTRILPFPVRLAVPGLGALKAARVGLPPTVERTVFALGNMVYIAVISRCGRDFLAAHTIGVRIEAFAYLPAFAMSVAASSMVGQETGRRDIGLAKRVGWEVAKGTTIFMVLAGLLLAALSPVAPQVFTDTPRILWLSMIYLVLAAISEPSLGLVMALAGSIRGAGNTLVPTVVNLASLYLFRVVPAVLLPRLMPPGLCAVGAWIAMDIDLFARSAIFLVLYRRGFERLARVLV